jgi:hypothetical protein
VGAGCAELVTDITPSTFAFVLRRRRRGKKRWTVGPKLRFSLLLEGSAEYGMFEHEYHNADDCHCDQICE